jgi:alginate O-acetyltransferase complex protein AlgI
VLFNSFSFLLFYLPITLVGFFTLARWRHMTAAGWLALASFVFYGWWDYRYIPLLLGSILFNFYIAQSIVRSTMASKRSAAKRWLIAGIAIDLALLAYFKYFNFFVDNVNGLTGANWTPVHVVLPIGISFFTFTQIAFLADTFRGEVREYNLIHYGLFVTYFPHLIAGPVLHHKEMMPQFQSSGTYRFQGENIAVGLTIFAFGLFKKVLLADNLASYVRPVFDAPLGQPLGIFDCWAATLAYTLQIYFDFSGYSDMAIGLSRLFGIQLPLNFNSPYKAVNIGEFWRRWHMTLSRFLRDYLYIPLGGNQRGTFRRYINLAATMLLGGLWHGAGWTYVIWGGLHGAYLVIHQVWQSFRTRGGAIARKARQPGFSARCASVLLTFLAVVLAWVFFRAPSAAQALAILKAMIGFEGLLLPVAWQGQYGGLIADFGLGHFVHFGSVAVLHDRRELLAIAVGLIWIWVVPNTQEVMQRFTPALGVKPPTAKRFWNWRPNAWWAAASAVTLVIALLNLTQVSDFLYFQF